MVGLIVPSDSPFLLGSSGANTKASPFVVAIQNAGVKGLPSVFNAVITIAVLSVANSCTFGSTRTFQALAAQGMAPKILAYVDRKGRPLTSVALQLAFALLAFINEATSVGDQFFNWLLALSGLGYFFTWGSICWAHLRFRAAWAHNGRSLEELPYVALFGIYGSWFGLLLNILCLMATFYVALFVSSPPLALRERISRLTLICTACWRLSQRHRLLPGVPCGSTGDCAVPLLEGLQRIQQEPKGQPPWLEAVPTRQRDRHLVGHSSGLPPYRGTAGRGSRGEGQDDDHGQDLVHSQELCLQLVHLGHDSARTFFRFGLQRAALSCLLEWMCPGPFMIIE